MQQKEINALDKQLQALQLRIAGVSYQSIADALGYKHASGAHKAVSSALKKTLQEPADDLRSLELARLDSAMQAIAASVKQGQYGAIDRLLKIMERRAKLLGLDAPAKLDVHNEGITKVEVEYVNRKDNAPGSTPGTAKDKE